MVESWFNPFPKIETSRQKPALPLHSIFGRKNMCGVCVLHQGVAATWCNITNQDGDDSRWCAGAIKDWDWKKNMQKITRKKTWKMGIQLSDWILDDFFFHWKIRPKPQHCAVVQPQARVKVPEGVKPGARQLPFRISFWWWQLAWDLVSSCSVMDEQIWRRHEIAEMFNLIYSNHQQTEVPHPNSEAKRLFSWGRAPQNSAPIQVIKWMSWIWPKQRDNVG